MLTSQINAEGLATIVGGVEHSICDQINADFLEYCKQNADESEKWTLSTGRHSRLTNMHVGSQAAISAFCKIADEIDKILKAKTAIYSSLYFEQSSEQALHRDSPFFCTEPYGRYVGVWIALEDVSPEAGPLQYVPGGHKVVVSRDYQDVPSYQSAVQKACSEMERKFALPKKGDVVIWHPELPHGGSPIKQLGLTRKSLVFHVCPEYTPVFGPDVFLQIASPDKIREENYVRIDQDRMMFNCTYAAFAPNN
jgi:phytanoyl-CoA hydroxylase